MALLDRLKRWWQRRTCTHTFSKHHHEECLLKDEPHSNHLVKGVGCYKVVRYVAGYAPATEINNEGVIFDTTQKLYTTETIRLNLRYGDCKDCGISYKEFMHG